MASTLLLQGSETDLTAATNVGFARLVRIYNSGSAGLVTLKSGSTVKGTVTLKQYECVNLQKDPAETLEGGAAFKVVSVGFTN